jgi:hypothetical protein
MPTDAATKAGFTTVPIPTHGGRSTTRSALWAALCEAEQDGRGVLFLDHREARIAANTITARLRKRGIGHEKRVRILKTNNGSVVWLERR